MYLKNKIMKPKFLFILCSFLVSLGIISCIKDDVVPAGDSGKTFLKFNDGPKKSLFYFPFTDIKDATVFNIRRDPNSEAALNRPQSVTVKLVPQLITDYNTAKGTNYLLLPANFYTYNFEPGMSVVGSDFTINYAAGEFAKNLTIKLDGAQWTDVTKSYALAYVVTNTAGNALSAAKDTMMTFFSIKNKWEGIYSVVSGTVTRYTAPGVPANDVLSGSLAGNPDVILSTSGATALSVPPVSTTGALKWAFPNGYVAGIDGLSIAIDPVTNLVTMTSAANATLTNWAGHENKYDPVTETFYLAFRWNPAANVREYEVVLKYKGPK